MLKRKKIRHRGKLSLSRFFQKFASGDSVAIVRELGVQAPGFPKRVQGRTGKIVDKKGDAYVVEVNDYRMKKRYSVKPIHLKKINDAGIKA